MLQDKIFLEKEGDNWFGRNKKKIRENRRPDPALLLLDQYDLKPKKVLEVGASNGWRLALIEERYQSKCIGIEPSKKAVADGKKSYPNVDLRRGLASKIPLKEKFDLVVVNYVLHWISREELLRSVAEIDRMVNDGGYLIIGDFLPDHPTKVPYHHLPKEKVYTYKQDYAELFSATSLYRIVAKQTFRTDEHTFVPDVSSGDRAVATLFKKSLTDYYIG